jgi:hypothetical protein
MDWKGDVVPWRLFLRMGILGDRPELVGWLDRIGVRGYLKWGIWHRGDGANGSNIGDKKKRK